MNDLFFISSAWNTGTGFCIDTYDFIVTAFDNVAVAEEVFVKLKTKQKAKVIFIDPVYKLAFVQKVFDKTAKIAFDKIFMTVFEQPATLHKVNYYGNKKIIPVEIKFSADAIDKNYPQLLNAPDNCYGAPIFNNKNELLGMAFTFDGKCWLLPSKYIIKAMEEFENNDKPSLRCPSCGNVVAVNKIVDYTCPLCSSNIDKVLVDKGLPDITDIESEIENIVLYLGNDLTMSRLGRHFWEIQRGSATIFIRYDVKSKFIVAFSALTRLLSPNKELYKFLLKENVKLDFLYFSLDEDYVFLTTPYIPENYFDRDFALKLFDTLAEKADYYDDILINMQKN